MHHTQVAPESPRVQPLGELEGDALGAAVGGAHVKTQRENADSIVMRPLRSHAAGIIGAGEPGLGEDSGRPSRATTPRALHGRNP
jgi:hypothetical protein